MQWRDLERLGEPSVQIGRFKLWVDGREFPDAADYWDGNWLRVTAACSSPSAIACTDGPIVHLGEIAALLKELRKLYETLQGEAVLNCIEPNLNVKLEAHWNGSIELCVVITHDQLTEKHSFEESLDQTYLPGVIAQCDAVLAAYPLREPERLP